MTYKKESAESEEIQGGNESPKSPMNASRSDETTVVVQNGYASSEEIDEFPPYIVICLHFIYVHIHMHRCEHDMCTHARALTHTHTLHAYIVP